MKLLPHVAIFAAGAITLGGLVGGGIVMAQDSGGNAAGTRTSALDLQSPADAFLEELATNLGIDVSKLKDAIQKTSLSQLDKAVAEGKLPKELADRIRGQIASGGLFNFGLGGLLPHGGKPPIPGNDPNRVPPGLPFAPFGANDDGVAAFLGITPAQLHDELNGKSLAEVAQAHGKDRAALKAFLIDAETKALDKAVADGKLPTEIADKMKAEIAERIDRRIDAKRTRPGIRPGKQPNHVPSGGNGTVPARPSTGVY